MKNDKIIASWNKIEPSDSAENRMLAAIIEQNHLAHKGKGVVCAMHNVISSRKLLPFMATCFVAIVVVAGIIVGYFG